MSNGVEVIVANDKSTLPGGQPNLRILSTSEHYRMPLTLAPSTLKDHMLLVMPTDSKHNSKQSNYAQASQVMEDLQQLNQPNQFVTKTCLTTYTYLTTYWHRGTTTVESREKVISNTATEARNTFQITPTSSSGYFLSQTPKLATGVFHTTYTYLNTFMDGDLPLVVTSEHTVSNTITAPDDYLSLLQPSESATTVFETNTYYSTIALTKRLTDSDTQRIISTTETVRQVVITESLPSKNTPVMTSYIAVDLDADKHNVIDGGAPLALLSSTDVIKTYYVTYTYFNTYLVNDSTIVRTNVSTSSDIVTEKLFVYPTKKATLLNKYSTVFNNQSEKDKNESLDPQHEQTINIYATKTYMTTYTYFTTLLQGPPKHNAPSSDHHIPNEKFSSTVVNSHTRVVENVITESIPINYLPATAIKKIQSVLKNTNNKNSDGRYTTVATLIGGQAIEITAVNTNLDASINKKITPSTTLSSENFENDDAVDSNNSVLLSNSNTAAEEQDDKDENNDIKSDYDNDSDSQASQLDAAESASNLEPNISPPYVKGNSTKIIKHKNGNQVSNLIGSLNFDGLKALGPMFNAVAGLINNNFGLKWGNGSSARPSATTPVSAAYTSLHPVELSTIESSNEPNEHFVNYKNQKSRNKFPTLLQSVSPDSIPKPLDVKPVIGQARNPIYIPVSGSSGKDGIDSLESQSHNGILLPTGSKTGKGGELILGSPTTKHKVPLVNGGIAISPGEVITANSDIIFGKPSGIRPRIPLRSNASNQAGNELKIPMAIHPPLSPLTLKPLWDQFSDSQSGQSANRETYVGPPPPIPVHRPHETLSIAQHPTTSNVHKIPLYRGKPVFINSKLNLQSPAIPPPKNFNILRNPLNEHPGHQADKLKIPQPNTIPLQSGLFAHVLPPALPNNIPPHSHINPLRQQIIDNNDIIEIQRIPEVYSTDLPPERIYHHFPSSTATPSVETISEIRASEPSQIFGNHQAEYSDIQTTNVLPEIVDSSTGQALLVNIQPSQIAKVVIPHGSTSALIYGGVQEAHKNGQYFDDPSPYPLDGQFIIKGVQANSIHSNVNTLPNPPNYQYTEGHHHVLSNQKVNVDPHIFSQDVNLHAPPIIFNNGLVDQSPNVKHYAELVTGNQIKFPHQHISPNANPPNYVNNVRYSSGRIPMQNYDPSNLYATVDILPSHQENIIIHDRQPINSPNIVRNEDQYSLGNQNIPIDIKIQSINDIMTSGNVGKHPEENDPIDHSQAPSIGDEEFDEHKDDDYINENGEFIQESNNPPLLVSAGQQKTNQSTSLVSVTTEAAITTSNTQTEANSLMELYITHSKLKPILETPEPVEYTTKTSPNRNAYRQSLKPLQQIPPAVINDLSTPHQYRPKNPTIPTSTIANHIWNNNNNNNNYYFPGQKNERPLFVQINDPNSLNIPAQHLRPPPKQTLNEHNHHIRIPNQHTVNQIGNYVESQGDTLSFQLPTQPNYVTRGPVIIPNKLMHTEKPIIPLQSNGHTIHSTWVSSPPLPTIDLSKNKPVTVIPATARPTIESTLPSTTKGTSARPNNPLRNNTLITQDLFNANMGKPFVVPPPNYFSKQDPNHNLNLNTGEVSIQQKRNESEKLAENGEIFDYKESINPHNYASVKEPQPTLETLLKPIGNAFDVYSKTVEKNRINEGYSKVHMDAIYPNVPSANMQPPPPFSYLNRPSKTTTPAAVASTIHIEEVMGLHPPPLPSQKPKIQSDILNNPRKPDDVILSPPPPVNRTPPLNIRGSVRFNSSSTESTLPAPTPPTKNFIKFPSTADGKLKTPTELPQNHHQYKPIIRTKPTIASGPPVIPLNNIGAVNSNSIRNKTTTAAVSTNQRDSLVQSSNLNTKPIKYYHEFNNRNRLPNDILLLGSEQAIVDDSTDVSPSSSITPHPPTILKITPTRVIDVIVSDSIEKSTWQNFNKTKSINGHQTESSAYPMTVQQKPVDGVSFNNRSIQILPTKYITNTKTLTVTSTKTTVIRSQGQTKTLTLTLEKTHTSTIIDTITHTLLQPTRITIEPVIKPTIYNAPVAMETVTGSKTSVMLDPSYSIHANPELIIPNANENDSKLMNTIQINTNVKSSDGSIMPTVRQTQTTSSTDSIFVVMTDRKKPAIINISSDMIENHSSTKFKFSEEHEGQHSNESGDKAQSEADYDLEDDELFNNLPNRDEDDITKEVNHVLLGGILIASPPRSSDTSKSKPNANEGKNKNVPHDKNHYDVGVLQPGDGHDEADLTDSQYDKSHAPTWQCNVDCKATKNEVCDRIDGSFRCICRPGFARMFPDHPCKPTYSYTINLALLRNNDEILVYKSALKNPTSPKTNHLFEVVHDAIDRMVMQSDLRDIYHGVHVVGFSTINNSIPATTTALSKEADADVGIETEFYLQLSDNSHDESQLVNVFQRYLQHHNYSLGGTNIYSSKQFVNSLRASDFDECLHDQFHDCSSNAYCFNLRGTYTCSCKENFTDLSENPIYPGRTCSAELIGCEKCHYHGTCFTAGATLDKDQENSPFTSSNEVLCECFQWYTGANCQINLKVLLFGLILLGGILFTLLLICLILTCWKRKRTHINRRTLVPGIGILPHKSLTCHGPSRSGSIGGIEGKSKLDRRAMIEDTSSETSEDTCTLPYVARKQQKTNKKIQSKNLVVHHPTSVPPKTKAPPPPKMISAMGVQKHIHDSQNTMTMEQKDRSLTVMIPRAKYHPNAQQSNSSAILLMGPEMSRHEIHQQIQNNANQNLIARTESLCSTAEAKLLSYLDVSPSNKKAITVKKSGSIQSKVLVSTEESSQNFDHHHYTAGAGALVSAGFEVSATVGKGGSDSNNYMHASTSYGLQDSLERRSISEGDNINSKLTDNSGIHGQRAKNSGSHLLETMSDWLENVPENELIISEARSYGETTIHPPTKSVNRSAQQQFNSQHNGSIYDKPLSTILMDEANTMAERDLGSTFLLPHTHLYKPDRGSDISGFDSL